ncbi:N-acetylmuramoyl-L-alanine amidase [Streptomyces sp. NPDC015532]|uniref:N-acetylmuramoyl-L-alanine amidase n=1 Tax=Streptomyces sp. NPDC015532 TaxID=3364960 RepID=UPI0036FB8745
MNKRRVWVAVAVVTAGVSGVGVLCGFSGGSGGSGSGQDKPVAGPVRTHVRSAALEVDGDHAEIPQRDTQPFSLVGLSWTKPAADLPGSVEVRARSAGSGDWGAWKSLDVGGRGAAAEESRRGATEPAWVGSSDGVQVRVDGRGSTLPAGLRLEMVDPGKGAAAAAPEPAAYAVDAEPSDEVTATPSDTVTTAPEEGESTSPPPADDSASPSPGESTSSSAPAATTTPSASSSVSSSASPDATVPPAPTSTAPKPVIVTRAQWGADESLNDEAPGYGTEIKVVFVHHTVDANTYTCAESAALVRAIRAYHIKSNGWKDIGYNFLVDKCGTIFEGRKGGVDQSVIGAHNPGFNTNSAGIAVLGEYSSIDASAAAKSSVAQIAAWKLGQYRHDPAGKVDLTASMDNGKFKLGQTASFYRISGHRDGYFTECPGNKLYASVPEIRALAGGPVTGLALKPFTGAGLSGTTAYTKGSLTVNWTTTTASAFIRRFDVLVDGEVATTGGPTATSAPLTLTPGSHTLAVRVTHISGKTTVTPDTTVVAETTAPTFSTKPSLSLRTGTVDTTAVPVTLGWKGADNSTLKEVRLTKPSAHTYGPTVTSAALTANSGTAGTWSMTAYDYAGNTASASLTATPTILQETSATRTGTWATKASSSYLGGKSYSSTAKNASLTWTFTGRSAAWVVSRAAGSGQADIYVDGVKATTVDMKSATTSYRTVQWTKTWSASGAHTVKIVVTGTPGRPTVTTDGLVYLK